MTKPRLYSQQLFEAGRRFSAPAGRRELLRERVLRQATGGALSATALAAALPKKASASTWALKAWTVVASCLVIGAGGVTAILLSRPAPEPASRVTSLASNQPARLSLPDPSRELAHSAAGPRTQHDESPPAPSKARPAQAKVATAAADQVGSARGSDAARVLALELALLRSAQAALSAGNAASALQLLEDHAVQFPVTRLLQERRAARVLALCRLNRREQAAREGRAFLADFPKSPLAARVESTCSGAPPP